MAENMGSVMYKVTCQISKCCQVGKVDLFVYADSEQEAFKNAKDYAIRVGGADSCKPLKAIMKSN